MTIDEAQQDLRRAFVGGGPGVFVSAVTWFVAALVARSSGIGPAFAVLFLAGTLIFPLAIVICRYVFGREAAASANPLGRVALESTIAMIGGLFAAWLFLPFRPDFVFPLAALAVGTHYFVFRTVYGDALFALMGALVTLVGFAGIYTVVPGGPILAVALIEAAFAVILTVRARRDA